MSSVPRSFRFLLPLALGALLAACNPSHSSTSTPTDSARDSLVGGLPTGDYPAVVALWTKDGLFCSGTLIGPHAVLTAGHCAGAGVETRAVVSTGPDAAHAEQRVRIREAVRHPQYGEPGYDLAVLRLAWAPHQISPLALRTTALGPGDVGAQVTHVGFGVTASGQATTAGLKRSSVSLVRSVTALELEAGSAQTQTCTGDSGGPALGLGATAEIVGVVSHGDASCVLTSYDVRADVFAGWVLTVAAPWEVATCDADGMCSAEGCTTLDPDCACGADGQCTESCTNPAQDPDCPRACAANGVCLRTGCPLPDPDCLTDGTACSSPDLCQGAVCVGEPGLPGYCSRTCDNDGVCTGGRVCTQGECRQKSPVLAQLGDACGEGTLCTEGECSETSAGEQRCVVGCSFDGDCPGEQRCRKDLAGAGACEAVSRDVPSVKVPISQSGTSGCQSAGGAPMVLALSILPLARRRRRAALAFIAALGVLGGGACTPASSNESDLLTGSQDIVGGTTAPDDKSVFLLTMTYDNGQQGICTATLIAPRTLLTAAHCVDPKLSGATSVRISASNELSPKSVFYSVVETRLHPAWNPSSLANDVALALFALPAPVAPVKAWNTTDVSTYSGKPLRAVGYGLTGLSDGSSPTRRTVNLTFRQVTASHIFVGDLTTKGICNGDSGGPSFHTFSDGVERLVGVHSFRSGEACFDGADTRIDKQSVFVQQWLTEKEGPQCYRDGFCVSNCAQPDLDCVCKKDGVCSLSCPELSFDPDCPANCGEDGICATAACPRADVDCIGVGASCPVAERCQSRLCQGDPQHPSLYCSAPCTSSAGCPSTMECAKGVCRTRQLPVAQAGDVCEPGAAFCEGGGVCTGPSGSPAHCERACTSSSDCGGSESCEPGVNEVRYCRSPPNLPPSPTTTPTVTVQEAPTPKSGCSSGPGLPWLAFSVLGVAALGQRRKLRRDLRRARA
jgi:uncharacterized protein (TIGR03382 family)